MRVRLLLVLVTAPALDENNETAVRAAVSGTVGGRFSAYAFRASTSRAVSPCSESSLAGFPIVRFVEHTLRTHVRESKAAPSTTLERIDIHVPPPALDAARAATVSCPRLTIKDLSAIAVSREKRTESMSMRNLTGCSRSARLIGSRFSEGIRESSCNRVNNRSGFIDKLFRKAESCS